MVKTDQNTTMYAGERKTLRFPVVDQDNNDAALNLSTGFTSVRWALSTINPSTDQFSTTPILEKKSSVAQAETGGNEIDFSNGAGTNDNADVELIGEDTLSISGDHYMELEGVDVNGEIVVLATGTLTINRNVVNT